MIKAVFLDFYQTLFFHKVGALETRLEKISQRYGIEIQWERYPTAVRRLFAETWVSESLLESLTRVMKRECEFIQALGFTEHVEQIAWELLQSGHPLFAETDAKLYEDVVPTLRELRAEGFKLAIVSNWDTPLDPLIEQLGIAAYFEAIIASNDARVRSEKPDSHIFNCALAAVGVTTAETVHVGDTYQADVVGARNVGIRPILLDRDGTQAGRWRETIQSLSELPALLLQ